MTENKEIVETEIPQNEEATISDVVDVVNEDIVSVEDAVDLAAKVVFISGHNDLDIKEYVKWYGPIISEYVNKGYYFVVGDCKGIDTFAQYQLNHLLPKDQLKRVKIFYKGDKPAYCLSEEFFQLGGFVSHEEAAVAMTICSDIDVAFVKVGRENTLTAQNIIRRFTPNFNYDMWARKDHRHVQFWKVITGHMDENENNEIILN